MRGAGGEDARAVAAKRRGVGLPAKLPADTDLARSVSTTGRAARTDLRLNPGLQTRVLRVHPAVGIMRKAWLKCGRAGLGS